MRRTVAAAALLALAAAAPAQASPELVVDLAGGRVLHAREAQVPWHPASLTKLMTTYVALRAVASGALSWDSPVTLSRDAVRAPPSRSGLPAGSRLALADALRVLMVKSANDVAVAVAEAVAGDVPSFVARMNAESARLGMTGSRWLDPNGLSAGAQVTTARDLAVLAMAIRVEFPQADPLFSIPSILLDGTRMPNHNKAVGRVAGIDGMKTGYICASGFNVVTTASQGGRRVAVVLLGRDSALERDARATLLAGAALATASQGIGSLADYAGAAGTMPHRSCGRGKSVDEGDGLMPPGSMARWVRAFADLPEPAAAPLPVRSVRPDPGRGPAPAPAEPAVAAARPAPVPRAVEARATVAAPPPVAAPVPATAATKVTPRF